MMMVHHDPMITIPANSKQLLIYNGDSESNQRQTGPGSWQQKAFKFQVPRSSDLNRGHRCRARPLPACQRQSGNKFKLMPAIYAI
jgi:hypothetical protein